MEGVLPFLRQKRVFVFACVALVFAVLAAFAPSMRHPFMSDDYHVLASLTGGPWDLRFFWTGSGKYLIPVTKMLWVGEYLLFGTNAAGYHAVSLLLHLLNTAMVFVLFRRLFKSQWSGLLTAALFALSASHWRTAMWMSAQMKMLAATFLLIALLAFLSYLRTGKLRPLLLLVVAQCAMPLTSALGVELPFVLAAFFLFLQDGTPRVRVTTQQVWKVLGGLLGIAVLYAVLERLLYPHANPYLLSVGGLMGLVLHSLKALRWLVLGLYEGFGHSLTGVFWGANPSIFALHAAGAPPTIRLIPLGMLLILLLLPKRKDWWKPAALFLTWTILLYAPPIFPDIAQNFTQDWFVTRARYFYVPAIPAAALLTLLLTRVRPLKRRPRASQALTVLLALFTAAVLMSNLERIATYEARAADLTTGFARVRDAYVGDLHTLLGRTWGTQVVTITDEPLGKVTGFDYAGHNVLPSHLAQVYLTQDERASFRFLPPGVKAEYAVSGQGTLWPPLAGR